jgi:hypothetical protein
MAGMAAGPVIGLAAPMARRIPVRRRICECQLASVTAARRPYGRSPDPPRQPEADSADTLTVCPRVAARFAARVRLTGTLGGCWSYTSEVLISVYCRLSRTRHLPVQSEPSQ